MCGIAGFVNMNENLSHDSMYKIMNEMLDTIVHRGPDDSGVYVDDKIVLGHRRLSILDLSPEGHQPMISNSGRYSIVFNGEIYNHQAIRNELGNYLYKGHSDTEVILAAFETWGIISSIKKMVGMFAIAVIDKAKKCLYLIRDRMGEKPLYYGLMGNSFMFGSELKLFKKHPNFQQEIDRNALALFLRHNYIPAPYSIYKDVFKLLPGTIMTIDYSNNKIETFQEQYWSLKDTVNYGNKNQLKGSVDEIVNELDRQLKQTIGMQMLADVSVGAFLSGGIDSTTIVSIMQSISNKPVKTFTIGFEEEAFNEARYAKAIASYLQTDHTELYVTPEEALSVIPKLPQLYDEPFSDSSQIPTFLVSKLAKQHVTVSLSGDAGDELFAGYSRYQLSQYIYNKINKYPSTVRNVVASGINALSPNSWNRLTKPFTFAMSKNQNVGDKLHKLSELLSLESKEDIYLNLISHWKNPERVVLSSKEYSTIIRQKDHAIDNFYQWMCYTDSMSYLPDDILVKVDRASMGVSLESRVPFLDHNLIELAWRIPQEYKMKENEGKWILKQLLFRYVPRELVERPKMGFGVPIDRWLRGPLKDWAEDLLDENRLKSEGYFNNKEIQKKWKEHKSGERNWHYYLWDILMFQSWLNSTKEG